MILEFVAMWTGKFAGKATYCVREMAASEIAQYMWRANLAAGRVACDWLGHPPYMVKAHAVAAPSFGAIPAARLAWFCKCCGRECERPTP